MMTDEVRQQVDRETYRVAKLLKARGVKPNISSGICGGLTFGYGELDNNNGYWQYQLYIEYDE